MVVGVEESQGLLLQDKEDSVEEFEVLVEVVELVQLLVVGNSLYMRNGLHSTKQPRVESSHHCGRR